jgi:hypothetical protein
VVLTFLVAEVSNQPVWWLVGATFTLAAVATFALSSLSDARKTRHGQVFAELSRRWDSERVLESAKLFREWDSGGTIKLIDALWADPTKKPDSRDLETWYKLSIYPNLIETIAVFVSENVISEEVVVKLWGPSIMSAWREWREPVFHLREITKTPEDWRYFEALGVRMAASVNDARGHVEATRLPQGN